MWIFSYSSFLSLNKSTKSIDWVIEIMLNWSHGRTSDRAIEYNSLLTCLFKTFLLGNLNFCYGIHPCLSPWVWMRLCRRYYVRNPSITYSSFSMLDILWLFQNNYWSLYSIFGTVICYLQFFIILHCLINLINCIYLNYAQHDNFTLMINDFIGQLFSLKFKQRSIGNHHNNISACQCYE